MTVTKVFLFGAIPLLALMARAQEFPRAEIGVDYAYARFAPSVSSSQGHSLNGGGGNITFNINQYFGIKADLQGFTSTTTGFFIAPNAIFPRGLVGNVQGNLFTYLFGPTIKVRTHGVQPFVDLLFGGAHSTVYGNAFRTLCGPFVGACVISAAPSPNAFAMEFGGGIDIPLGHVVSFRPAEVDYLLTRFSNPLSGTNNQNNFRYSVGLVFALGNTQH